jgi:hypothetical protein
MATMYYNAHSKKKKDHIFNRKNKETTTGRVIRIPRPEGGYDEVEIL